MEWPNLNAKFSSDLRYVAFLFGNGTMIISDTDIDYLPFVEKRPDLLVKFFILYFHEDENSSLKRNARVRKWLRSICDPKYELIPSINKSEFQINCLNEKQKTIIEFTDLFCSGKLNPELITEKNILNELFCDGGSPLEQIYAVLANLLGGDPETKTQFDKEYIFQRASQMVKDWICPSYRPNPKWADWEVKLW